MNPNLKALFYQAIEKVIQDNCEEPSWDGLIHPRLTAQMTDAACVVFDAAMDAQVFAEMERGVK